MYWATLEKLFSRLDDTGKWKTIAPVEIDKKAAPCKEVVLRGDEIDILKFPWLKNNPADAGRYINTGAVFIGHPDIGRNVGTYRCQVKGKNKIGMNARPGQDGGILLRMMRSRGEKIAKIAIALGVDPVIWSLSTTKMADFGQDELEIAGGLRGKPVQVVKCETSDILVPAHAEMILEGEVPLDDVELEGPYGEAYGYLGHSRLDTPYMIIKAVTHRRDPLFYNSYTGITADMLRSPLVAADFVRYKKLIPNLVACYHADDALGITIISIDKKFPGEGLAAGQYLAASTTVKVAIVVDKDVNGLNMNEVVRALGSRWQPYPGSLTIHQSQYNMPDPSLTTVGERDGRVRVSSKIVIDATRQLPGEGGPNSWPAISRDLLREHQPDVFKFIDAKWPEYWKNFRRKDQEGEFSPAAHPIPSHKV
jgi:4-hydroxy-3-polyprenylbenzoate decarboxylase